MALVARDGELVAYVCDGDKVSEWLSGRGTLDDVELTNGDGLTLTASRSGSRVAGTLTLAGAPP